MSRVPPPSIIVRRIIEMSHLTRLPSASLETDDQDDEPQENPHPAYWPPGVMAWDMLTKHPDRYGSWPVTDEALAAISACLDETDQKQDTLLQTITALRIFANVCRLDLVRHWRERHPNPAADLQAAAVKANELAETVGAFGRGVGPALARISRLSSDRSATEAPYGWLLAARSMAAKIEALANRLHAETPETPRGPVPDKHVDNLIRALATCYDKSGSRRRKRAFVEACMVAIETSPILLSRAFKLPEMPTGRALERRMPAPAITPKKPVQTKT